ncbi:MFS transporter [Actinomadura roseirufa]|uniref:MFS transporter n=1 Tax=Actinomadura roseirufa TaxID=2094049 RepID=UPI001041766A|nr:MFS transporter [Actinomadura roseirufa]
MTEAFDTPATYRAVLAVGEARWPFLGSCAARLSFAVLPLALILLIRDSTGSFAVAGFTSGALSCTLTLLAPARARLIDRRGARYGLRRLTVLYLLGLAVLVVLAELGAGPVALVVTAAVAGAFAPPFGPTMRVLWSTILRRRQPLLQTAYALDSVTEEILFTAGPLVAGGLIAVAAPLAAMITVMALIALGGACFLLSDATRDTTATDVDRDHVHGRPLSLPGIQTIVLSFAGVGLVVGALEVGLPYIADRAGSPSAGGVLLALLSAGSAIGGIWYGRKQWRSALPNRFVLLIIVFTLTLLPLCLTDTPVRAGAAVFIVGLTVAPLFTSAYLLVNDLVTASRSSPTEANTWVSTANNGGAAAGSSLAGLLLDAHGPALTFTATFLAAGVIAAATILRRPTLAPPPLTPEPAD